MSTTNSLHAIEVIPTGAPVGAEVKGVDLSQSIPADMEQALRQAWYDHLVLVFRHQALGEQGLLNLAEAFGGAVPSRDRHFHKKAGVKEGSFRISTLPGVGYISNLDDEGKPAPTNAGLGSGEVDWHTDNSYVDVPPAGSALYSVQLPIDGGGDTAFNNQYMAYDTLPEGLKKACWGKYQRHDISRNSAGVLRPTLKLPTTPEEVEGPIHPLLRVHPATGKTVLYLGRRRVGPSNHIIDMDYGESQALLGALWDHATQDAFTWTQTWQLGDLIIWDNRCLLHHRTPVDPTQPRVLYRTLTKGEPIIAPWDAEGVRLSA